MMCPLCHTMIDDSDSEWRQIGDSLENTSVHCNRCHESLEFLRNLESGEYYGWSVKREHEYSCMLKPLLGVGSVLYVSPNAGNAKLRCMRFALEHGTDVCIVSPASLHKELEGISRMYKVVEMPDSIWPEVPSYLAERLVSENATGSLYSLESTVLERFKVLS